MASGMGNNVNSGFVCTGSGVVVFDTGSSVLDGQKLKASITKITDEPIIYVINSLGHINHCGGNSVFDKSTFLVHGESKNFTRSSTVTRPNSSVVTFNKDCCLCIGGLMIELRFFRGHACGSLVMVIPEDNVVLTGNMLMTDGLPSVNHSSLCCWVGELEFLEIFNDAIFIPGHGPVADAVAVRQHREYLENLIAVTSVMKRDGLGIDDLDNQSLLELPYAKKYINKHKENLRTAFLQVA